MRRITAPTMNETPYSTTDPMAINARTVDAMISLLLQARPEGAASVDAFPRAVSVVSGGMAFPPFPLRLRICDASNKQKQTFPKVSRDQDHHFVGNDLKAFCSFIRVSASGVSS